MGFLPRILVDNVALMPCSNLGLVVVRLNKVHNEDGQRFNRQNMRAGYPCARSHATPPALELCIYANIIMKPGLGEDAVLSAN